MRTIFVLSFLLLGGLSPSIQDAEPSKEFGRVSMSKGTVDVTVGADGVSVNGDPDLTGLLVNDTKREITGVHVKLVGKKPNDCRPPALRSVAIKGRHVAAQENRVLVHLSPGAVIKPGEKARIDIEIDDIGKCAEFLIRITPLTSRPQKYYDLLGTLPLRSASRAVTLSLECPGNAGVAAIVKNDDESRKLTTIKGEVDSPSGESITILTVNITDSEDKSIPGTRVALATGGRKFAITSLDPLEPGETRMIWIRFARVPQEELTVKLMGSFAKKP